LIHFITSYGLLIFCEHFALITCNSIECSPIKLTQ
jgi:hypothetical protein